MKVLIAEDDRTSRKILEAFLLKESYEVVMAEDGASALKCALTFTEPYIAILDWVMPGLTGPQVCVCLRSPKLKIRPYIIVLSSRSDKADIAAVLDAGADDFLTKPFNQVELMARLRVAGRALQYHSDLRQQIAQLEALAQRYNLLGEIVGQQAGIRQTIPPMARQEPVVEKPAEVPVTAIATKAPEIPARMGVSAAAGKGCEAPAFMVMPPSSGDGASSQTDTLVDEPPPIPLAELTPAESNTIMQGVIAELGFGKIGVIATVDDDAYGAADFTAWAGMILEREQVWVDLLLEVDSSAMAMIFEQTLGRRPNSDQERENFLAETHTIVTAAFKSALLAKGAQVMTPILSRVMRTKDRSVPLPDKFEKHRYVLAGGSIGLSVIRQECLLRQKSTQRLRNTDIMAEAYPPPSAEEVPLLSKGTVLTYRFIEKLVALEEDGDERLAVPVFSTSRLAEYFMSKSS